jgi:hypothetical protein
MDNIRIIYRILLMQMAMRMAKGIKDCVPGI